MKIAIIGAGVAGLTAAHRLRAKGYRDITVYERETSVGGKVCSYTHDGRAYELGALWSSPRYRIIGELAEQVAATRRPDRLPAVLNQGSTSSYARYLRDNHRPLDVGAALLKLARTLLRYPMIRKPTLTDLPPALCDDFDRFAGREGFQTLADVSASFFTGCGYLQNDRVPAIYLMKMMHLFIDVLIVDVLGLKNTRIEIFDNGWQELWKSVAKDFDVRCSSTITQITRHTENGQTTTAITVDGATDVYDRLILASPLDRSHEFMDLRADEHELFSKIQTHRYKVSLIEATSLPHASVVDHVPRTMTGHVNLIARQHRDADVFTVYQQLEDVASEEGATELMLADVATMGARDAKVITAKTWSYFPHVSTGDIRAGFYESMSALQGRYGTYYAGSVMNMETVEHTAQFSVGLVDRCF
ncbi:FAD-dependent oxidoreductase [Mycobacterium sp. RTGN5]|uniref:FAD-dependent oxidoreductase n=1 Tax=Mycobacterium sp. RTGN5 TaxID=3016522 RepID=UPI0029C8DD53|nr:FAD-dependent oxidoreductase [Mycobacterium sp. RTGN5]